MKHFTIMLLDLGQDLWIWMKYTFFFLGLVAAVAFFRVNFLDNDVELHLVDVPKINK